MSMSLARPALDDDFWNDCNDNDKIKIKNKTNNINTKKSHAKPTLHNFKIKKQKKNKLTKKLKYPYNLNLSCIEKNNNNQKNKGMQIAIGKKYIQKALLNEELIPRGQKLREQKSIENLSEIYFRQKELKEIVKKKDFKKKEINDSEKFADCTFKPEIRGNSHWYKKISKNSKNSNIYDRNIKNQKKQIRSLAMFVRENNEELKNKYFFQPTINTAKNYKKILYYNNFWKEQADNESNKLFLLRYMKAREMENEKNEKKCYIKKINHNLSQPKKLIRSISQKDSLYIQKTLHDSMFDPYCYDSSIDEDNTQNNEIYIQNNCDRK